MNFAPIVKRGPTTVPHIFDKPVWDKDLISIMRSAMPNLIAYDICDVQPITGPSGLIFTLGSYYNDYVTYLKTRIREMVRKKYYTRIRDLDPIVGHTSR